MILTGNPEKAANGLISALERYRRAMEIPAKLVVVSMAAGDFRIQAPSDPEWLNIAGFDASVPSVIGEFLRS